MALKKQSNIYLLMIYGSSLDIIGFC